LGIGDWGFGVWGVGGKNQHPKHQPKNPTTTPQKKNLYKKILKKKFYI